MILIEYSDDGHAKRDVSATAVDKRDLVDGRPPSTFLPVGARVGEDDTHVFFANLGVTASPAGAVTFDHQPTEAELRTTFPNYDARRQAIEIEAQADRDARAAQADVLKQDIAARVTQLRPGKAGGL